MGLPTPEYYHGWDPEILKLLTDGYEAALDYARTARTWHIWDLEYNGRDYKIAMEEQINEKT